MLCVLSNDLDRSPEQKNKCRHCSGQKAIEQYEAFERQPSGNESKTRRWHLWRGWECGTGLLRSKTVHQPQSST